MADFDRDEREDMASSSTPRMGLAQRGSGVIGGPKAERSPSEIEQEIKLLHMNTELIGKFISLVTIKLEPVIRITDKEKNIGDKPEPRISKIGYELQTINGALNNRITNLKDLLDNIQL